MREDEPCLYTGDFLGYIRGTRVLTHHQFIQIFGESPILLRMKSLFDAIDIYWIHNFPKIFADEIRILW
jgi:hypothetical protein